MTGSNYQLHGDAPELYEQYLVPAVTSKWAADLVARARPIAGESVLDVACGTGIVARLAAKWMERGQVTGLDVNAGMLRVAQAVPGEGAPIAWIEGSALALPFPEGSFDLVLCQLGLQFFSDQGLALREMLRVLSSTGRVALSVFSAIEHTPGAYALVQALDHVLGTEASRMKRDEHAFHHPDQLQNLLIRAGFSGIDLQTVVQEITFPSVLDYVRFQLVAGPMSVLLATMPQAKREVTISRIADETRLRFSSGLTLDGVFSFPQEAYVAMARKHG